MITVNNEDIMQYLLIGLLLLMGYFYLCQFLLMRAAGKSKRTIAAIVLFLVYAAIAGVLIAVFHRYGSPQMTLLMLLVLMSMIGFCVLLYNLLKYAHQIKAGPTLLLILYLGLVSYFTIFSREGGSRTGILLDYTAVARAVKGRSFAPLENILLNIAMFIPIGSLFPAIYPEKLNKAGLVVPFGLMLSVMIETVQMILQMGFCDLEDLAANTLGAFLGLIAYRLVFQRSEQ